jgi:hypothetical protein
VCVGAAAYAVSIQFVFSLFISNADGTVLVQPPTVFPGGSFGFC